MPNEVIIRTKAVGLNPIDWKSVDYNFCMPSFPWIGGREVAGIVEEVGANVTDVKVGDRVWASMLPSCCFNFVDIDSIQAHITVIVGLAPSRNSALFQTTLFSHYQ